MVSLINDPLNPKEKREKNVNPKQKTEPEITGTWIR